MTTPYTRALTGEMTDLERRRIISDQESADLVVILAHLDAHPEQTMSQIERALGMTRVHVQGALTLGRERGSVTVRQGRSQGNGGMTYTRLRHGLPTRTAALTSDAHTVRQTLQGRTDTRQGLASTLGWDETRVVEALARLHACALLTITAVGSLALFTLRATETRRAS